MCKTLVTGWPSLVMHLICSKSDILKITVFVVEQVLIFGINRASKKAQKCWSPSEEYARKNILMGGSKIKWVQLSVQ